MEKKEGFMTNKTKFVWEKLHAKEIAEGTVTVIEHNTDYTGCGVWECSCGDGIDETDYHIEDYHEIDEWHKLHSNPDYTTPSGFFELKAKMMEDETQWDEFLVWYITKSLAIVDPDGTISPDSIVIGTIFSTLFRTPTTFLDAAYEFFKEKGE